MRRLSVLFAVVFALSTVMFGQQQQQEEEAKEFSAKGEFFAGYSYMRSDLRNYSLDTQSLNGVTLQATAFPFRNYKNFGVTADITRETASDVALTGINVSRYTYLFGPTYELRTSSAVTPFVHVLFGADHERFSISNFGDTYSTTFASGFGGGIDVRLIERISFRLGQFDYIHTNHSDGENHFRYSTGVVLKF